MRRFPLLLAALAPAAAALAAGPAPWSTLEPGSWSVSRSATGSQAENLCVHDFLALAQWQERGRACHATILSHAGNSTVVRYSCAGGDFGQSILTVVTPRSVRIDTQGIHRGGPFHDQYFARKSGTCPNH